MKWPEMTRPGGIVMVRAAACLCILGTVLAESVREKVDFNAGWRFHLGATPGFVSQRENLKAPTSQHFAQQDFDDSTWRLVSVPHDFVVEGTFSPSAVASHGFLPTDAAWYRKTFSLPSQWAKGSSIWVNFDGVYRASNVYFNGALLAHHESGYTSFQVILPLHLAKFADGEQNVLAVFCDARKQEGWWYEGGGIYRHVWLYRAARVHIPPYGGIYAPALVSGPISDQGRKAEKADMKTQVEVRNTLPTAVSVLVQTEVFPAAAKTRSRAQLSARGGESEDRRLLLTPKRSEHSAEIRVVAGGKRLSALVAVPANATVAVDLPFEMADRSPLNLWSPEQPALYTLRAIVSDASGSSVLDAVDERFGIRKVQFDPDRGFLLNGRVRQIKGMCNHQDFGGTGTGVPMGLQRFRIRRQQEFGVDGWRMSHNPPNPELLDMLDEEGMLVWNENRNFGNHSQWMADFVAFLRRDRNHPSVVLWSICNEAGCDEWNDARASGAAALFKDLIAKHDPHGQRPMTAAMNAQWGKGVSRVIDVQGINYAYQQYDEYRTQHPSQPLIGSETASCTTDRGVYVGGTGYCSAYPSLRGRGCVVATNATTNATTFQCQGATCLRAWMSATYSRPWVAGGFGWTGFDYKGEPTPDGWPTVNAHYGAALDMVGLAKDAFWYYKAWWRPDTPVIHILPHWNWKSPDPAFPNLTIPVWVYTNANAVRLSLNGKWLSEAQPVVRFGHATFHVRYAPGTLTAVGFGPMGDVLATTAVTTSGRPARLVGSLLWGGMDGAGISGSIDNNAALVQVDVQDSDGVAVPTASPKVTFKVTQGRAVVVGVGSGDPSSHEPDRAQQRSAFAGSVVAVVQALPPGGARGGADLVDIVVEASADGLRSARVRIPVLASPGPATPEAEPAVAIVDRFLELPAVA